MDTRSHITLQQAFTQHSRRWQDFVYCYPVVSRRSRGLSIGVNLNPDKACNFDCIYCQVDRRTPPTVRKVDLNIVRTELAHLLDTAIDGSLFQEAPLSALPPDERCVRDIAFSGDGEPTTYPQFEQAVQLAADLKRERNLDQTRLVLITDACYLLKPNVVAGLRIMDENNGEVWAKLDAGTQAYYEQVNRPNFPLTHVLHNILETARFRPIVIQSLWMRVFGQPPPDEEISHFAARINEMIAAGGHFKLVQIYTIARNTTEAYATPLTRAQLDHVANIVRAAVTVPIETFYGVD